MFQYRKTCWHKPSFCLLLLCLRWHGVHSVQSFKFLYRLCMHRTKCVALLVSPFPVFFLPYFVVWHRLKLLQFVVPQEDRIAPSCSLTVVEYFLVYFLRKCRAFPWQFRFPFDNSSIPAYIHHCLGSPLNEVGARSAQNL